MCLNVLMAKTTVTVVSDDLDGGKADRNLEFSWDGVQYEIDLSKKNAAAFEKAVAPFLTSARRVRAAGPGRRRTATTTKRTVAPQSDLGAVREWANSNGHPVSSRGRIPSTVLEAYNAAH